MLQIIIKTIFRFYTEKNRWWIPVITGLLYSLCLPPFNHETSWIFAFFPFLSFVVLIPLFLFSVQKSFKRALHQLCLYSFFASLGQFFWIGFVTAEGLWHLILLGLFLACFYISLWYIAAGLLFRYSKKYFPRLYLLIFPALWVLLDYTRTLGEVSFPWAFLGYSFAPILPISQIASITGVWGITFLIVLINGLCWEVFQSYISSGFRIQKWLHLLLAMVVIGVMSVWGFYRTEKMQTQPDYSVTVLQTNIDQLHWGKNSLDTAVAVTRTMVQEAAEDRTDLIVLSESALLCYFQRNLSLVNEVQSWSTYAQTPLILGSLHCDKNTESSAYEYNVYNSAFLIEPYNTEMKKYHKVKLVPFSEALPFEGVFPILSRVNLGEADFQRGKEKTIFSIGERAKAAPFICYEIVYPGFVRDRVKKTGTNLIVNITNDGWFGKTSGPFQHASMVRMRAIENGISLVRCANSGISMIVDQVGKISGRTGLYTRTSLKGNVSLQPLNTFYSRYGDWVVFGCMIFVFSAFSVLGLRLLFAGDKKTKIFDGSLVGPDTEECVDSDGLEPTVADSDK